MTCAELQLKLNQLAAETPLTAAHVAAVAEVLLPVPDTQSLAGRTVTEVDLVELLGESESTLKGWRMAGTGSAFAIGPVMSVTG